jgi:hypothetical protein
MSMGTFPGTFDWVVNALETDQNDMQQANLSGREGSPRIFFQTLTDRVPVIPCFDG